MAAFARAAGQDADLRLDPETVLCDLLADLMHWCDTQTIPNQLRAIDFQSALGRALRHHAAERVPEGK